jgi:geranylgeranyl transferase type-2 subunit alpha
VTREDHDSQILDIIQLDLQFLFSLLLKFPKCYWIWNHRLWLLEQATLRLPPATARRLWGEELGLVGKMLTRDSRNFHGWGYRRTVIASLESKALNGNSMAQAEFDYTTKMIGLNLSNFSAWHNRSKLILSILNEKAATDEERHQMLDDGKPLDYTAYLQTLTI